MKRDPFPQTKEERVLLTIAHTSYRQQGDLLGWVDWKGVAKQLGYGEKSCENMVQILARTYLVQKRGEQLRLTHVSFRHYGEQLATRLGIDRPVYREFD